MIIIATILSGLSLLIQDNHDLVCSLDSTVAHYTNLVECGVPAINMVFPWTAHGFDLLIPHISPQSPPAQSAMYDVDRFLALKLKKNQDRILYLIELV